MDRERRKNLNRMSIHLAAVKLFSEKQYDKVTMAEIAAEAHLTKRTVYKYYPSKISLLSSVFESYTQEEYIALSGAVKDCKTGEEMVLASAKALYRYTKDNLRFMRLLWSVNDDVWGTEIPREVFERIKSWNDAVLNVGAETMGAMSFEGVFSEFPIRKINYFLSAVNKGIFLQVQKISNQGYEAATTDELFEIALAMYRRCMY